MPISNSNPTVVIEKNIGQPKYWKDFFQAYFKLTPEELGKRAKEMQRLLKENGVTYTIYNDLSNADRSWEVDTIPYIIPAEEWRGIEAGLQQRTLLLNAILHDIYGEQQLIKNKIIPAELIYEHPGFVRQMAHVPLQKNIYLPFYSADLARSIDGRMWVIADRTQAPSGSGYALENRQAMARALPELFAGQHVRRLSHYFTALSRTLVNIAPHGMENPRVVILTPGPGNETYFEHAYLASYLGVSLVEGNDLMVKGDYVWLKTMEGLERIDVIVRRVDDNFCDSLELKPDSVLGVSGLLQIVRKGNVTIANPIGSSILENAGLIPFYQQIADFFGLGQLSIPSIATWWCGQEQEKNYVLAHFDTLIIKKIHRMAGGQPSVFDTTTMSERAKKQLKETLLKHPNLYVGQERMNFTSIPTFNGEIVENGHAIFRSFITNDGTDISVMRGGLTRTGDNKNGIIISNQIGCLSKDTWILGNNTHEQGVEQHNITHQYSIQRGANTLPSHTAESLFWVGRYLERTLGVARLLKTVMQYIYQGNKQNYSLSPKAQKILLQSLTAYTYSFPGFIEGKDANKKLLAPWEELYSLTLDIKKAGSLAYNLQQLRNNIFNTREYWNLDIWKIIHQMNDNWNDLYQLSKTDTSGLLEGIESLCNHLYAILGLNRESVRRDQGWRMMDIGRKLEQSLNTIVLFKSVFPTKDEEAEHDLIEALLYFHQSLATYRLTYRDHLQMPLMLDLLVLDTENPKSLSYTIGKLKSSIAHLPQSSLNANRLTEQERMILEADTSIQLADKYALSKHHAKTGAYSSFMHFLDEIYDLLFPLSDIISKAYFKHTLTQKQLVESQPIL